MNTQTATNCLIHLRLHYQLLLAPIFLWGYFLAGGYPDSRFWLAFVAFHLFLYGGLTAYNSYYDRDEGPVGGLEKPPPATAILLPFSLTMQFIGAAVAALVNRPFLLIYLVIFGLATAYSHPAIRLKGRPLWGLLVVGLGQGILAALGGWAVAEPTFGALELRAWLGIVAVTLVTVGFYPITQIYQIEEDLARGDLTFAAWAGPTRTFIFAVTMQALAAFLLVAVIDSLLGLWQAVVVGLFYSALLAATIHWALHFEPAHVIANFRRVMRMNQITSLGFLGFLVLHLFIS
ncbi:MAG: UbiA prenyltransferase family protein [Caldilineaceae bacterium]|nr:UbiA prenyltransferase family protein [Caldilineaceae bacterium]